MSEASDGGPAEADQGRLIEEVPTFGPARPSEAARRSARVLTRVGIGLFWVVLLVLYFVADVTLVDAILLAVLLAAVPGLAVAQVPLVEEVEIERMPAYWSSIATLWILGTGCWLVGSREGGSAALGLVALPTDALLLWTLGLTAAGLLVISVFHGIASWWGLHDSRVLVQLLPRSRQEKRVFALLSVAAGTGEELAFRGYAIPALAPLLGVGGAAVLTTVVFGVVHAYQGVLGIVRTGLMGGVLAWGFLASGSLWPAVVAHTVIDLVAGIWIGDKLLVRPDAGVTTTPEEG